MKQKLTQIQIKRLIPKIKRVLETGKPWESEKMHYPAGAMITALLSIHGMAKDDQGFDTNGWQYDWWQAFTHGGKKYTLSGSGYYGGHSFGLADE